MANLTGTPAFKDHVRELETTDPKHPDTWNPNYQQLINNDVWLKAALEATGDDVDEVSGRVNALEATSSVSVQRAVTLDWLYRNNRISFELWSPGFTLIDTPDVEIIEAVAGDDSIDVEDTSQLRVGQFYVLADDENVELVQCSAILSNNRIRTRQNLNRTFTTGVLTRCSMPRVGADRAEAREGDIWLSRPLSIGVTPEGGAVIIRRSLSSTRTRLFYRSAIEGDWVERDWSVRRQDGDIPAGFADYEYIVPLRGEGNLRIEVAGGPVAIRHIVAVSHPTGLGGYVNPNMRPDAPVIATPVNGEAGVWDRPTLSIANYSTPSDTQQAGLRFQISLSSSFASVLYDSGERPAGFSLVMPANVLQANTEYFVRAQVLDRAGLWSDWSAVSSFNTAASFAYAQAPSIVVPINAATEIGETPAVQLSAFAVVGDTPDTHAASQLRIRASGDSWSNPLYDSGENTSNLLTMEVPAGYLQAGEKTYYLQARHKGDTLGWSGWSDEIKITTKAAFALVAGVALITAGGDGGSWAYIDDAGNTVPAPGKAAFDQHPVFGGMETVILDGQHMVKVPKFYVKHATISGGDNDGKLGWWVSDQPLPGYHIHPAFRDSGQDIDQFYYGKYQASMQGSKLASVPGVLPAVSRSLTQFIADAQARNAGGVDGFMLHSYHQLSAVQWLYLVENATMDSQGKTGQGRVSASSAANVDASDVAQAAYRNIVGLWGNVWQWIDGLKTVSGVINLWDNNGNRSWVATRQRAAPAGAIYPLTFMTGQGAVYDLSDNFIGDTGPTSNSGATAPDYQYMNSSAEQFPLVGGGWSNAAHAGLWFLNVSNAASYSYSNIGSRLAKV